MSHNPLLCDTCADCPRLFLSIPALRFLAAVAPKAGCNAFFGNFVNFLATAFTQSMSRRGWIYGSRKLTLNSAYQFDSFVYVLERWGQNCTG
jgi:hypothetical protein